MTLKKLKKYKLFKKEKLLSLKLLKNQGFCNINYLLKTSKAKYLIRKFKKETTVNISREYEFKIQKKAYKKNIGAKPLLLDKQNQLMICFYLEGKHKEKLNIKEIKVLAKNIKKLHKIKSKQKKYDLKNDLKYYKNKLNNKKARKSISICKKEINKLKAYKTQLVTSHHDLNPKNIIFYKKSIKFIDWEYTGVNDIFFDLATICSEFHLDKREKTILLKKYFKYYKKKDEKKLSSFIIIYKNICKLWFMDLEKSNS